MQVNLKYLQSLAKHIAPKSDVRYYLNGVLFEVTEAGRFYVATDGHKLVAIREARQETDANGQWIIPRDVVLGIKLQKAGRNLVEYAELETDGAKAKLDYCSTGTVFAFADGKFPDWRRVVPSKTSGEIAQYNPDYLVAVRDCAAATAGIGKYSGLYMLHNGTGPGLYQCASHDFIGLVMPLRADKADAYIPAPTDLHVNWGLSAPAPVPEQQAA
jgi:DNA polymerase-3 subunit beta